MSEPVDTDAEARRLDGLYREKARAEIEAAEALIAVAAVRGQGDVLAEVVLVKGEPGTRDLETGRALAGADGVAIGRALDALGLPKARYAFCTRATTGARSDRGVRMLIEAIDPRYVILLDAGAACDFASAFGVEPPAAGAVVRVRGRTVLAVDDFASSLGDDVRKRRAWKQLRALVRPDRS